MIKKSGYALLSLAVLSLLESIFLGLQYFIVFSLIFLITVCSDIIIFNTTRAGNLEHIWIQRNIQDKYQMKGRGFPVQHTIRNDSRRTLAFHYYDTLSDVFTITGESEGYLVMKPGESRIINYRLVSGAIGKYMVGPVVIYSEDAMKLCLAQYVIERADEVRVSPSLSELSGLRSDLISNIRFTSGIHRSRNIGQGYNFFGIRPYTISDDFRYVAWSRFGVSDGEDLQIKQMEEERQLDVYLAFDYSYGVNLGHGSVRMFDRIVINVINAGYSILKNHDGIGFIVFNGKNDYFLKATRSDESIRKLENLVAEINPGGTFDLFSSVRKISEMVKKTPLVILITPLAYSEKFEPPHASLITLGSRLTVFLLEPSAFIDIPEGGRSDAILKKGAILRKKMELKAISSILNRLGLYSYVSSEDDLFRRIMAEYQYGKILR